MSARVRSILSRRDTLILEHLELVRQIAHMVKRKLPQGCFDLDDLVGEGTLGLIHAASEFDPGRGVEFGAFARKRIKGAMLDSVGLSKAGTRGPESRRNWEQATRPPIAEHAKPDLDRHDGGETPDHHTNVEAQVTQRQTREHLNRAIAELPHREGVLVEMFYGRGIPIRELGRHELFGVGVSRLSQVHTSAIEQMRTYFALRGRKAA